jgi:recombination protein RecT
MTEEAKEVRSPASALVEIKKYLKNDDIKERFAKILGNNAEAYMATIVNVMGGSDKLQECDSQSIMNAAFNSAAIGLSIDPNLGHAAIIPFKQKAQLQIMTKGYIQLAISTKEYAEINVSDVYADELKSYNPITEEIFFNDFTTTKQRAEGDSKNIIGYYAFFILKSGYHHSLFMTVKQIDAHGKRFSQTFKKGYGLWVDDQAGMRAKTVIKRLITKYGYLSPQMEKAVVYDQATVKNDGTPEYLDNMKEKHVAKSSLDEAIDAEVQP